MAGWRRVSPADALQSTGRVAWNLLLILAGSVLCALGINGLLVPNAFLSGGFVGLAMVLYYLLPLVPLGAYYFLLNVPLFAVGWMYVGRRFFLYSIAGMAIFSGAVQWVQFTLPIEDKILAALLAGILSGIGSGIILRSLGSAGGSDVLAVIFLKRLSVRLGTTVLTLNTLVLSMGALLFSLERALYTLLYIYVTSQIVNLVVTGWSQRKGMFIISGQWERIYQDILKDLRRGVTILHGEGGYTRQQERILFTVVTFRDLPRIKQVIRRADPSAFVVITDTLEVMGQRMGNEPHW